MTFGPFATEELKSGRLVQPFKLMVPHRHEWQYVCRSDSRTKSKLHKFENWLVKQIAADPYLALYREGIDKP